MTSYEFEIAAKNAVMNIIQDRYGETYGIHEMHFTSFSHVLGNKKATLIDCGNNARYYEVTYDLGNDAMYVDVYEKQHNILIPGKNLDFKVHE